MKNVVGIFQHGSLGKRSQYKRKGTTMVITIGWHDLNDAAKLKVAKAYGYKTAAEFEANENYDLYPCAEFDVPDNNGEDGNGQGS
jgi:hypothetical protein